MTFIWQRFTSSTNPDGGEEKNNKKERISGDNSIIKVDVNGIVNNCTFIGAEGPALVLTGDQVLRLHHFFNSFPKRLSILFVPVLSTLFSM